jgi:uncharacterized protein YunC (DUF1805 family)
MAQLLHEFRHERVKLAMKTGEGYVIPMGPTALVAVVTDQGVVGNDLLDTEMLENFDFPAAKIAPAGGDIIESLEDLIEGEVRAANLHAVQRRVEAGMTALEALNRL